MSAAFAIGVAAGAAACAWPARGLVTALGTAAETTAGERPAGAVRPPIAGALLTSLVLALLAFWVAVRVHPAVVAVAGCWLATCGVPLAIIDARTRRLPDVLTATCVAGLAVLLTAAAAGSGDWSRLARAAGGALAVAAFFATLAAVRPGSAGLGDAKLGLSTGALAAWFGWTVLLWALFAAFALAACYGLGLVATGRASVRGSSLPFGPFLLAGCLLAVSVFPR